MRISELSRTSGVPLPTVKYYLREGLLPAGTPTGATQADYGAQHLDRLRLVRALVEVGGLSIAGVRAVLLSLETSTDDVHGLLGAAHGLLPPRVDDDVDVTPATALLDRLGWRVHATSPAKRLLARAMEALEDSGLGPAPALEEYARVAHGLAEMEVAGVPTSSPEEAVRYVVLGTVLHEPVLIALRRLAQEDASRRRFPPADADSAADAEEPGTP